MKLGSNIFQVGKLLELMLCGSTFSATPGTNPQATVMMFGSWEVCIYTYVCVDALSMLILIYTFMHSMCE